MEIYQLQEIDCSRSYLHFLIRYYLTCILYHFGLFQVLCIVLLPFFYKNGNTRISGSPEIMFYLLAVLLFKRADTEN